MAPPADVSVCRNGRAGPGPGPSHVTVLIIHTDTQHVDTGTAATIGFTALMVKGLVRCQTGKLNLNYQF